MQEQRKHEPTTEQLPRIDRAGAQRLIASAGPDVGRDGGQQWSRAAHSWFIKTSSWHAIVLYGAVLAGVMTASLEGPQHAWSSGGLLRSPPDSGAGGKEFTMMKKMSAAGVAAVMIASQAMAGGAVQWRVEDGGNGHWYKLIVSGPISWNQASLECESLHGHLATINDPEEDNVVANVALQSQGWNFQHYYGPWLGGYQETSAKDYTEPRGGWKWVTGEPWQWAAWEQSGYSEPNNCNCNCGDENFLQYKTFSNIPDRIWNDVNGSGLTNCPQPVSFIIEWDADCNNDGIVDYGQCHNGTLADYNTNNIPDCCERGETCVVGRYPVQWRAEVGGNSHWYSFNWILNTGPEGVCWPDARQRSIATGGELVSLASASEAQFLVDCFCPGPGSEFGWMGNLGWLGYQGTPVWSDGEPVTYTNWYPGQPSGDGPYVAMGCQTAWNDIGGSGGCHNSSELPLSFWVTEWSADCNNDSIVDYGQILTGQLADSNTNGVPDICEQPRCQDADITNNHIVDGADLGALLAFWGPVNPVLPQADVNRDGQVNGADIGILLSYWGPCP